jgi:membrane protease YdiL (CAAX protease family)
MKTIIREHPVGVYFALTFAISWGAALIAVGGAGGMHGTTPASDPRFAYAVVAMLAGPSLSGVLMTGLTAGFGGLRRYRSRLLRWRGDAASYSVAVLLAPVLMTATLLVLSIVSPAFIPGIVTSDSKGRLLAVSLAVGLSAGIFEELGWTGFAIPAVRHRHGVFTTGVIVGIWWSAWHLFPLIWASQAAAGSLPMPAYLVATVAGIFVGYLTAFRVLMTWVYERTGSLLIGMMMHVSITASLLTLNPLDLSGAPLQFYSFALAATTWLTAAVITVSPAHRHRRHAG